VGDGVTNDSVAINAAITYAKTYGVEIFVPAGIYVCRNLRLESGAKSWALRGAAKDLTIFKHFDGDGTLMIGNDGSSVPYELSDFTVDCQYAETANINANNAISFADTAGVVIKRVRVKNYKNNGILGFASVSNTFGDCVGEDCEAIGNGATTNNGLLFAEMPRCKWVNCVAKNIEGSPGYGIQLKNDSRWGQIVNGLAVDCVAGLAFGSDTVGLGAQNVSVQGFQSFSCITGAELGEAKYCKINGLIVDMESAVENGVNFSANTIGCSVYATVRNINALRSAARFRSGSTDNFISIDVLDNINSTGKAALFDSGSLRNSAIVERVTNPTSLANGPRAWVTFTTAADNNCFELRQVPYQDALTISSGAVTLVNAIVEQTIAIDTESSAATDDLDTITNNYAREGQRIIIRTSNDARDVVVKYNTGNIVLSGAADFTLTTRRSMLCLVWNTTNSKWNEAWRVTNP